jgi:hypothetical protein
MKLSTMNNIKSLADRRSTCRMGARATESAPIHIYGSNVGLESVIKLPQIYICQLPQLPQSIYMAAMWSLIRCVV